LGYTPIIRWCLRCTTSFIALIVVVASSALTFYASIAQENAQSEGGERDCPIDSATGGAIPVAREEAEEDPEMRHCYCRQLSTQVVL